MEQRASEVAGQRPEGSRSRNSPKEKLRATILFPYR